MVLMTPGWRLLAFGVDDTDEIIAIVHCYRNIMMGKSIAESWCSEWSFK
jgi:hypothetical protein